MDESLRDELRAAGYEPRPWHEALGAYAPDRLRDWLRYASSSRSCRALEPKVREFIVIALDSLTGWKHIDAHVEAALNSGATVEELVEVLVTVGYLKGPHAWVAGFEALHDVVERRREDADAAQPPTDAGSS